MVELIRELVESGHAYVIEGEGVYFSVASYARVRRAVGPAARRPARERGRTGRGRRAEAQPGRLRAVEGREAGRARLGVARGVAGRPGWHIECSAMSLSILGEGFDLHGGGDDLVFPHHENERAQAEAAGHAFATHWIHSGMVMVGGEKMSKSLNNFTTLGDALDRYGAAAFRLAVLQVHYRSQMELTATELGAAAEGIQRVDNLRRRAAREGVAPGASRPGHGRPRSPPRWTTTSAPRPRWPRSSTPCAGPTPRSTPGPPTSPRRSSVRSRSCSGRSASRAGTAEAAADDDDEIDALVRERDAARAGARLRDRRPHPRRARAARRDDRGQRRRHDLAPLTWPRAARGRGSRIGISAASRSRGSTRCASCCGRADARCARCGSSSAASGAEEIARLAADAGARVRFVGAVQLEERARSEAPQGVLAFAAPVPAAAADDLIAAPDAFLVVIDGITDPGQPRRDPADGRDRRGHRPGAHRATAPPGSGRPC